MQTVQGWTSVEGNVGVKRTCMGSATGVMIMESKSPGSWASELEGVVSFRPAPGAGSAPARVGCAIGLRVKGFKLSCWASQVEYVINFRPAADTGSAPGCRGRPPWPPATPGTPQLPPGPAPSAPTPPASPHLRDQGIGHKDTRHKSSGGFPDTLEMSPPMAPVPPMVFTRKDWKSDY